MFFYSIHLLLCIIKVGVLVKGKIRCFVRVSLVGVRLEVVLCVIHIVQSIEPYRLRSKIFVGVGVSVHVRSFVRVRVKVLLVVIVSVFELKVYLCFIRLSLSIAAI